MTFEDIKKSNSVILLDGAMGTYISRKKKTEGLFCEKENITSPELIQSIHEEYIKAGAKIIRTNTFSANTQALDLYIEEVLEIVEQGYKIAEKATNNSDVMILCSMGEATVEENKREEILLEYKKIADRLLSLGANNFLFESISSVSYFSELARYIKQKNKNSKIFISFALSPRGRTYIGEDIEHIAKNIIKHKGLFDVVGLNCGCGPTYTVKFIKTLKKYLKNTDILISAMPNSGMTKAYSDEKEKENTEYFASVLTDREFLKDVNFLGGCCGTTPEYIKRLGELIQDSKNRATTVTAVESKEHSNTTNKEEKKEDSKNNLEKKLNDGKFILAAELDPPYGVNIEKLIKAAKLLKNSGIDIITISDSPMARARLDSVVCSAKIKREVGIDVLPHICCRDKNLNALKSSLLAVGCEGIRNILAVTGDKIQLADRKYIKPVFDVSSITLMMLIAKMNEDVFCNSPIQVGGALNFDYVSEKAFLNKAERKIKAGAKFFLTQPLYNVENLKKVQAVQRLGAKVLVGIMPIVSYKNAMFMNNEIQGIDIPQRYINSFNPDDDRQTATQKGIKIALENIEMCRDIADGLYFMTPFNRAEIIGEIVASAFK